MPSRVHHEPALLLLAACGSTAPTTRHALVLGWDGVRADAIAAASTPSLDRLSVDTSARTQLTGPTVSAAGWMSILTGVGPDKHGVTANGDHSALDRSWPTLLARTKRALPEARVVLSVHWPEILTLTEDDATDAQTLGDDDRVQEALALELGFDDPTLLFGHLDDPDAAGHATGFRVDNADYITAVEESDARLGTLLDAITDRATFATEDWLVVVTTDHGGEGTDHGPLDDANQTIFLAVAHLGGAPRSLSGTSHLDVAPTVLDWLGVPHDGLDGTAR